MHGALCLHVWGGGVWCAGAGRPLGPSGLGSDAFAAAGLADRAPVRLVGHADNARLAVRLYERRLRRPAPPVELLPPAILAGRPADPAAALHALLAPPDAVVGGGHVMRAADLPAYELAVALDDGGRAAEGVIRRHPAWPALSFLAACDVAAAARLLVDVMDPRWFRHPRRPHRVSRLASFLGLTPGNMRAALAGGPGGRHFARARRTVAAWFDLGLAAEPAAPRNFLWRVFVGCPDPALGLLRACRRFARFLYEVWLGAVTLPAPEAGFGPESFFKCPAEVAAFRRHRPAAVAD